MGTYVIAEPCIDVKDGTCVEVCPVACIHTTASSPQYYIDPEICIECEQCVLVCPVDAIYPDVEVPAKWAEYLEVNAQFFTERKPPTEPISRALALEVLAAAEDYGRACQKPFAIIVIDASGEVVVAAEMEGVDASAASAALESARKAAQIEARTPGGYPIFDRLDVIGGVGAAGGSVEENGLVARAGKAAAQNAVTLR
jgi:NAD-dependent dihydropyrimidine dehydrogenase PreA subunit/uncharacterized protein GlcG (DUF336 family)